MANTTNFGWETPDDTDLVKDGALAMRTLGNAIDTSLVDLKGGTTGQVLSKTSNTDMDFTWTSPNPGDITEVTVSSPITGGGSSGSVNIAIQDGTTAQKGAVQLEDSTSSTSTTKAATPNSVKTSYDLANAAIPKSLVDAKADLITATADNTPARLAVGSNGDILVADSAATTGLRWQGNFAAGKNKIINGDFSVNQKSFTSTSSSATYTFDRWRTEGGVASGSITWSAETFTAGTAPVAGYESRNFFRTVTSGQAATGDYALVEQRIEDVRTFANQAVTISFWAKASSGTPKIGISYVQNFGSGGSSNVNGNLGDVTLSTSWARYSVTTTVASISGKTIGTGSFLRIMFWTSGGSNYTSFTNIGVQNATIDIWGVQVENGSVATAFQTATGTLQGETALCQRYYYRTATGSGRYGVGFTKTTTTAEVITAFPVTMRTAPTALEQSGTAGDLAIVHQNTSTTLSAVPTFNNANVNMASTNLTVASGLTAGNGCALSAATGNSYLGWSAEL